MAVGTDTMSITELAERLGVSPSTAYELAKCNELPFPAMKVGDRVLISRRAYDSWLAQYDYQGEKDGLQDGTSV